MPAVPARQRPARQTYLGTQEPTEPGLGAQASRLLPDMERPFVKAGSFRSGFCGRAGADREEGDGPARSLRRRVTLIYAGCQGQSCKTVFRREGWLSWGASPGSKSVSQRQLADPRIVPRRSRLQRLESRFYTRPLFRLSCHSGRPGDYVIGLSGGRLGPEETALT